MTPSPQLDSPWPHRWSLALVGSTFPLIWVGGLVTTTDAGMAVPDWPNTFGYNLFLYPWTEWLLGPWDLFIEHGHRLLGAVVGMLTIGLVIVLWRLESRPAVRWLGVALLLAVVGQGVLGGARVLLDERTLAMIHGCMGPLFFAMAVAMSVFTSRAWMVQPNLERPNTAGRQPATPSRAATPGTRRWISRLAAICTMMAFAQIVLGALIRHVSPGTLPSTFRWFVLSHVVLAIVLATLLVWLALVSHATFRGRCWVTGPTKWLAVLMLVQLGLGGSTWLLNFAAPTWLTAMVGSIDFVIPAESRWQSIVVTAHVAVGSLIFALALVATLRSGRIAWSAEERLGHVTGQRAGRAVDSQERPPQGTSVDRGCRQEVAV